MKPDTNGGAPKASNRRAFLRAAAVGAAVLATPHVRNAEAARSHVWKVQSTWDAGTTGYRLFEEWAKSFQEKSDGELEMRPFPAKAVAADNNALFDAVRTGVLQGMNPFTLYWSGKIPASVFLSSYPAGPDQASQWDTMFYGLGLLDMTREIYQKFGLFYVGPIQHDANIIHSKQPVESLEQLQGMKIRLPGGMVAEVFEKFGVSTTSMPGSDIYPALEKGTIDAADYVGPAINWDLGFAEVTNYIICMGPPGQTSLYQPVDLMDLTVNMGAWKRLPEKLQGFVEEQVQTYSVHHFVTIQEADLRAMAQFLEAGTTVSRLVRRGREALPPGCHSGMVQVGGPERRRQAGLPTAARLHAEPVHGLRVAGRRGRSEPLAGANMSESANFVLPHWLYWVWLIVMPPLFMLVTRRRGGEAEVPSQEDGAAPGNRLTRVLDWLSDQSGIFVALWTVNAVCAYFFEVVARYIFNAPTIWVHQASFLMFGMQYLLAGAFAYLHGDHVRVDVLYVKLPKRGQAGADVFTSIFFFICALALLGSSWRFFMDAVSMFEVTEETWRVQLYPVKGAMVLGAVLLVLAGLSKLLKDLKLFIRAEEAGRP